MATRLVTNLNFLISAVIAQTFHLIAELVIPIGAPSKETKVETEFWSVNNTSVYGNSELNVLKI